MAKSGDRIFVFQVIIDVWSVIQQDKVISGPMVFTKMEIQDLKINYLKLVDLDL
jgi:hypothetical protein